MAGNEATMLDHEEGYILDSLLVRSWVRSVLGTSGTLDCRLLWEAKGQLQAVDRADFGRG